MNYDSFDFLCDIVLKRVPEEKNELFSLCTPHLQPKGLQHRLFQGPLTRFADRQPESVVVRPILPDEPVLVAQFANFPRPAKSSSAVGTPTGSQLDATDARAAVSPSAKTLFQVFVSAKDP